MADYSNEYAIYARSLLGLPALAGGNVYYVDPANGADGNDGQTPETAVASVARGYALCTSGQNDIVALIGNGTGTTEDAITWSKSYTHLVGICAPTDIAKRARIFMTSTATDTTFFTVSGTGCMFKNFYIFHGVASTSSLICWADSGGRNYYENVHFAGIGHATGQGDEAGARSLKVTGEEITFERCTIGVNTTARTAANAQLELASQATRIVFRDCRFLSFADSANPLFATIPASGLDREVEFHNCKFQNSIKSTATTMTAAFSVNAAAGGAVLLFDGCELFGATDWEAADGGLILISSPTEGAAITYAGLMRATDQA